MRLIVGNTKTKVIIGGKDNLSDYNVMKELKEYLRVRPNGYFHVPSYKKGDWDGYRYFITPSKYFATGFLELVVGFAESLGLEVVIDDQRTNELEFKKTTVEEIELNNETWQLYPDQKQAIEAIKNKSVHGIDFHRGIINVATNGGKSYTMAFLHENIVKPKTLLLIHNQTIYDQHFKFFSKAFKVSEVNSKKLEFGDFTLAMVKTLHNRARDSVNVRKKLNEFKMVMVDEAHRAGGKEYSRLLQWIDCKGMAFFTGTPFTSRDKVKKLILVGLSGKELTKLSKKELIDAGRSQEPLVTILKNPNNNLPSLVYEAEVDNRVRFCPNRMKDIIELCTKKHSNEQILIPVFELEHGDYILKHLNEVLEEGEAEFVHGTDKQRKQKIKNFEAGYSRILITTTILQEGVSMDVIRVMIMAAGGKDETFLSQFSGRGERHDGVHDFFYFYDWYDEGKWVSEHSRKRIKYYRSEEFKVTFDYLADKRGIPKKL